MHARNPGTGKVNVEGAVQIDFPMILLQEIQAMPGQSHGRRRCGFALPRKADGAMQ